MRMPNAMGMAQVSNKPGSGSKERLSCTAARKLSFPDCRMATPQFSEEQMVYIQEHLIVPRPATSSVPTTNDPSAPVPPTV